MKNLKKVLALVIVFAMMVSSVAFAAIYPDVAVDADYAKAVDVLSDLEMIKGDDKGNFNPDATITRAEFATMIVRLLGVESAATGKADFTDVAADHWATGYIAMAQQQGIISGYGDGTFGPENPVKYEEAVKMLVCALGYEPMAASKGGWVAGYTSTAYSIGLLANINGTQGAGAPRSMVAQLCYNALDIPMMEQTGFGTEVQYTILDGKTSTQGTSWYKTTLLTKMGIYKLSGVVAANSKVAFYSDEDVQAKGIIALRWDDCFYSPVKKWLDDYHAWKEDKVNKTEYCDTELLEVGNTDIEDVIGNKVVVYVRKNVSKYEILSYEIDEATTTMTISAKQLDDNDYDWSAVGSVPYIKYYKEEGDARSSKISLAPRMLENGAVVASGYVAIKNNDVLKRNDEGKYSQLLSSKDSAIIELVDYSDDGKFDVIRITEYSHAIVEEVITDRGIIVDKNSNRIDFAIDDPDKVVTIKDINGNDLELKDIAQGDVLAMVVNESKNGKKVDLKNGTYDSLDVIVLKDSFVAGAVEAIDDDEDIVYVGDKKYDFCDDDDAKTWNGGSITLQSEGTFYIGIDGESVIGFEGDLAKSGNYAFIIDAYWANNKETGKKATLTLVTKDGVADYKLANKVRFIDEAGKAYPIDADETDSKEFAASVNKTAWDGIHDDEGTTTLSQDIVAKFAEAKFAVANVTDRTVKVALNSSNEITAITPVAKSNDYKVQFNYYAFTTTPQYREDATKLGTKAFAEGAVVIDLDTKDLEKSKFTDVGYFVDEAKYDAIMLDVNSNGEYSAAVVYSSDVVYAEGDPVAVVKSVVSALNDEGETVTKVVAYKGGEEVTLVFDDDTTEYFGSVKDNDFGLGTVFMYSANSEGIVEKYDVIGNVKIDDNGVKDFTFAKDLQDKIEAELTVDDDKTRYNKYLNFEEGESFFYGYIVRANGNKLQMVVEKKVSLGTLPTDEYECEKDSKLKVDVLDLTVSGANEYTMTGTKKSTTQIVAGDYKLGNVASMFLKKDNDTEDNYADDSYEVSYVFVRTYEGEVVDIMSLDAPYNNLKLAKPFTKLTAPVVTPVAPVAPVVEEKAEVKEEIVELEGFDL